MKLLLEQVMETSKRGLIFSIQRFALHDGQGIRTTLFLKGCNLRCVWCHNPEGLALKPQIQVSHQKCIYCHRCQAIDKDTVMKDMGTRMEIENRNGIEYQQYIDICPTGAIHYDAKYYTIETLLEEVLKDQVFFKYGGGVTISGGEPLLQVDFVTAFLKCCKELSIHTAIETALHVTKTSLQKVLPFVDTLYCDIKEIDAKKHIQFTGVDNTLILDNVHYLLTSKYRNRVVIRTPLIPEHTATSTNIQAITNYIKELYPEVSYELLNYNPLAFSKYQALGKGYCLEAMTKKYTDAQMRTFEQWTAYTPKRR